MIFRKIFPWKKTSNHSFNNDMRNAGTILFVRARLVLMVLSILLADSCSPGKPEQNNNSKDPNIRVIKEYYPDGKLKSSTEALGQLRHGESREYRKDGSLESIITYENNRKHGPARSYYPDGKTVKTEVHFVSGLKHGEARWNYPDGNLYRLTPYLNGRIVGVRKVYYENGNLQAEIVYQDGEPGVGLKEYNSNGTLREFESKMVFSEIDRISLDNTFVLTVSLSDGYRNVEYFSGKLSDGQFWNEQLSPITSANGVGVMEFFVSKGSFKMETINIIARIKTNLNNYLIIQREYHLALENKH